MTHTKIREGGFYFAEQKKRLQATLEADDGMGSNHRNDGTQRGFWCGFRPEYNGWDQIAKWDDVGPTDGACHFKSL